MKKTVQEPPHQIARLLRLIENTLQDICCHTFEDDRLYSDAVEQILGSDHMRGPESIFIVFNVPGLHAVQGRVFQRGRHGKLKQSELITINQAAHFAINMSLAEVVSSYWDNKEETLESYQKKFHPFVRQAITSPIRNFATKRIKGDPAGAVIAFNFPDAISSSDLEIIESLAVVLGSLETLISSLKQTENAFIYTIEALARSCEAADHDTGDHITRVNLYAKTLAQALGLSDRFIATIAYSAQMHDVGKVHVPSAILNKTGRLTSTEIAQMQQHPAAGARIIGNNPRLAMAREIALAHHESWDGSGYPHGLRAENIPQAARIVKIVDIYDALRSQRSYKAAMSHHEVMQIFRNGDERIIPNLHLDPLMLKTFFTVEDKIAVIFSQH